MKYTLPPLLAQGRGRWVFLIVLLTIAQAAALAAGAFSTRQIFSALYNTELGVPLFACCWLLGATIIATCCYNSAYVIAEKLGYAYATDFRANFYERLTFLPQKELVAFRKGALALRFVGDVSAFRHWVSKGFPNIVSGVSVLLAGLTALCFLEPILAASAFLPLLLTLCSIVVVGSKFKVRHQSVRSERSLLSIEMMERVAYAPQLRLLGRLNKDLKLLYCRGKALCQAATERATTLVITRAIVDIGTAVAVFFILLASFATHQSGASVAVSLALIGIISLAMQKLVDARNDYSAWQVAREKYNQVHQKASLRRPLQFERSLGDEPLRCSVENVGDTANESLSFSLVKGGKLAIYEPQENKRQGLFAIFAGLNEPESGRVLLNSVPYCEIPSCVFSHHVHAVSMHSPIIRGSCRRLLTLGLAKRPSDAALEHLCKAFNFWSAIEKLGGLNARVEENGANLTMSEQFYFFLIRAALAKPNFLVINDPGGSINSHCRASLLACIKQLNSTVILLTDDPVLVHQINALPCGVLSKKGEAA